MTTTTVTVTGSETTIHETDYQDVIFTDWIVDTSNVQAGDEYTLRLYTQTSDGPGYDLEDSLSIIGAQDHPLLRWTRMYGEPDRNQKLTGEKHAGSNREFTVTVRGVR